MRWHASVASIRDRDPAQFDHSHLFKDEPPAGRPLNRAPELFRESVVDAYPPPLESQAYALNVRLSLGRISAEGTHRGS